MEKNKGKLKEAGERHESFLSFVTHEASSERYQAMKSSAEAGEHPPDDMLRDYVLDRLDEEKSDRVMAHLAVCEICLKDIRLIREEHMEEIPPETIFDKEELAGMARQPEKNRMAALKEKISELSATLWFRPLVSGLAAACLVAYLMMPRSDIGEMVARSYETAFTQNISFARGKAADAFRLPRADGDAFSFMSLKDHAPGIRAFAAGLWAGRAELRRVAPDIPESAMPKFLPAPQPGKSALEEWSRGKWAICFHLGRWSFLMRAACLTDTDFPPDFWKQQADISGKFMEKIDEEPDIIGKNVKFVRRSLARTASALKTSAGKPDEHERGKLLHDLDNLVAYIMR